MRDLRLEAAHTHLYPSLKGRVFGALPSAADQKASTCQVAFSDGAMALGTLETRSESDAVLETDRYTTAAGTSIPAKRWRLQICHGGDGRCCFRVREKLPTS